MRHLWGVLILVLAGCNRHDTESLSRMGRKIATHAKSSGDDVAAKLDLRWSSKKEPTLHEKIADRLRFENTLTDVTFEVFVKDREVELKGTVKTDLQRQRAVELAETVAGVEKVTNSLQVTEANP